MDAHPAQRRAEGLSYGAQADVYGRELSDEELANIRQQLEDFDKIRVIDDEMRRLIAEEWPELLAKVEPKAD